MPEIRISVDVGGVLSRYPQIYSTVLRALAQSPEIELYVLSDMHPKQIRDLLNKNGLAGLVPDNQILSADWKAHGEDCKRVICQRLDIDVHIDDLPSYLTGAKVGLLQMPRPGVPYNSDAWQT